MTTINSSTIALASLGAVATGFLAYAVYFDQRRRSDPEFRRALKREYKKVQKAQKAQAEASAANQIKHIRRAVEEISKEPVPKSPEEIEAIFLAELANGEKLQSDDTQQLAAAKSFYRALKVYPSKSELISLYEHSVPKPILDILAQMIAMDESTFASTGLMMDEVS